MARPDCAADMRSALLRLPWMLSSAISRSARAYSITADDAVPLISSILASPSALTTIALLPDRTRLPSDVVGSFSSNVGSELYFSPRPACESW